MFHAINISKDIQSRVYRNFFGGDFLYLVKKYNPF